MRIDQSIVENMDAYNFNPAQNCTLSNILCDIYFNTIHPGCFEINCLYVLGLHTPVTALVRFLWKINAMQFSFAILKALSGISGLTGINRKCSLGV